MQDNFSVVLNGPDCKTKKREISRTAKENGKTRSEFMLWLYDQFVKKGRKTNDPGTR
jgi:hypothetical protein